MDLLFWQYSQQATTQNEAKWVQNRIVLKVIVTSCHHNTKANLTLTLLLSLAFPTYFDSILVKIAHCGTPKTDINFWYDTELSDRLFMGCKAGVGSNPLPSLPYCLNSHWNN